MFENFLYPQIQELEATGRQITFGLDGAPPHFGFVVRDALNDRFPGRWIGRAAPIPWPPRSPDLTPLDFYLWGHVKDMMYSEKIHNLQHLVHRITQAIESITTDNLASVWREVDNRLDICRACNGQHIEIY